MHDPGHELEQLRTRLHDTTLQALELIARGGQDPQADPAQHAALAAREAARLRQYLEGASGEATDGLECGLRALVAEAQELADHEVLLIPGATDGSVRGTAAAELVAAAREALTNARKHAKASRVVVYCESSAGGAFVTVKDDGVGVDLCTIETGLGVRNSIHARMARVGGNALLDSSPGEGTLVTLWLEAEARRARETQLLIGPDSRKRFLEELGRRREGGESTVMAVAFGAAADDERVERISLVLRGHVRDRDVVASLDGGRLGLLLDRVPHDEAPRLAQRLFQLVLDRAALGQRSAVPCGFGLASLSPQSELSAERALLEAERAGDWRTAVMTAA